MIGIVVLTAIALWLAISIWIAWRIAKVIKRPHLRRLCFFIAAPLLIAAPLADEIVGKYQFERYCENAKEVRIFGTIPVGEELYTPDGKWRLSLPQIPVEELKRLRSTADSLLRWDFGSERPREVPAAIPIEEYDRKIYDARTGRLLAQFHRYSNGGGWIWRNSGLGGGSGGFLLPQSCAPALVLNNSLDRRLLPFRATKGDEK